MPCPAEPRALAPVRVPGQEGNLWPAGPALRGWTVRIPPDGSGKFSINRSAPAATTTPAPERRAGVAPRCVCSRWAGLWSSTAVAVPNG